MERLARRLPAVHQIGRERRVIKQQVMAGFPGRVAGPDAQGQPGCIGIEARNIAPDEIRQVRQGAKAGCRGRGGRPRVDRVGSAQFAEHAFDQAFGICCRRRLARSANHDGGAGIDLLEPVDDGIRPGFGKIQQIDVRRELAAVEVFAPGALCHGGSADGDSDRLAVRARFGRRDLHGEPGEGRRLAIHRHFEDRQRRAVSLEQAMQRGLPRRHVLFGVRRAEDEPHGDAALRERCQPRVQRRISGRSREADGNGERKPSNLIQQPQRRAIRLVEHGEPERWRRLRGEKGLSCQQAGEDAGRKNPDADLQNPGDIGKTSPSGPKAAPCRMSRRRSLNPPSRK